jgi:hypothetical protein
LANSTSKTAPIKSGILRSFLDQVFFCSSTGPSLSPLCEPGDFLFLVNEIEISQIDKISRQIGQDENGIHPVNGIKEDDQPSGQAQVPERDRDDTFLFFLRSDPLNDEPHGEHQLADEPEDQPEIEMESRISDGEITKEIGDDV